MNGPTSVVAFTAGDLQRLVRHALPIDSSSTKLNRAQAEPVAELRSEPIRESDQTKTPRTRQRRHRRAR